MDIPLLVSIAHETTNSPETAFILLILMTNQTDKTVETNPWTRYGPPYQQEKLITRRSYGP